MHVDLTTLPQAHAYRMMTSAIMPRPIAWVSTISKSGKTNLAPFSFFQGVTANPPTLLFVPVNNREGMKKDTLRNIEEVPEFVVNVVPHSLASAMNDTAANLPYGESEFQKFLVAEAPSAKVRPPRVAASPVSFECTLDRIVAVGEGPLAASVVFGRIVMMHVRDDVLGKDGLPDSGKLDLVGRLGHDDYARTQDAFNLKRPDR